MLQEKIAARKVWMKFKIAKKSCLNLSNYKHVHFLEMNLRWSSNYTAYTIDKIVVCYNEMNTNRARNLVIKERKKTCTDLLLQVWISSPMTLQPCSVCAPFFCTLQAKKIDELIYLPLNRVKKRETEFKDKFTNLLGSSKVKQQMC